MTVKHFVDPNWQEAALDNARKGYPWAVWGKRLDHDWPLVLLAQFADERKAHEFAARSRLMNRPGGQWVTLVVREPV